jgi:hypothetical protein
VSPSGLNDELVRRMIPERSKRFGEVASLIRKDNCAIA